MNVGKKTNHGKEKTYILMNRVAECGLRQLHCSSDLNGKSRTYRLENREKKRGQKEIGKKKKKKERKKKKKQ